MFNFRSMALSLLMLSLVACGGGNTASDNPYSQEAPAQTAAKVAGSGLQANRLLSLQVTTPGYTNRYARHANGLGFTEVVDAGSGAGLKEDASWKAVPGLADGACYSFQSVNFPNDFLRHSNSRVIKSTNDNGALFKSDATWCAVDGLSGTGVSFQSKNYPGRYLRHYAGQLWMSQRGGPLPSDGAGSFNEDVSWNIAAAWSNGPVSGGGGDVLPAPPPGRVNVRVLNATNGAYPNDQIYWAILGNNPATGALSYVNRNGQLVNASPADNDAPNRLNKNGVNYANYFTRLSETSVFTMPKINSGRMFMSVGSPMFIKILGVPGGVGFAGPDINNPSDPNQNVSFEFSEFTYNDIGYFGNTTRVDQFGFPLRMRLVGNDGFDRTLGENVSRETIFRDFENLAATEFRPLVKRPYRIVAPKAGEFAAGRSRGNYFDGYVNQVWDYYRNRDLVFSTEAGTFRGRVQGNDFVFSKDGGPSGLLIRGKPTSIGIFEASGNLASGNSLELVIQAQIAAAFNRHLLIDVDPSQWSDANTYYRNGPANFYSKFWHDKSIDGLAYGFAYDDVRDKSTSLLSTTARQVDFIIGW